MEDDDLRTILPEEKLEHVGYFPHRTLFPSGDLERAFAYEWMRVNESYGGQHRELFLDRLLNHTGHDESQETTQRDARVAATIIQWLGSNIGFGIITQAFRQAGYRIIEENRPEIPASYKLMPD